MFLVMDCKENAHRSKCVNMHLTSVNGWVSVTVLTASVVHSKAPQIWNVISHDHFVGPRGFIDSFDNLILFIRIIKEGIMDSNSPWVGKVVHQDHPLRSIHVSSFNLKDQRVISFGR